MEESVVTPGTNHEKEEQMNVMTIMQSGFAIGMKNLPSVIGASLLWILTIWIPYLNVGTTIAMVTLPISLSKGQVISPLEIFDPKYRRNMGEFFVLGSWMFFGIYIAMIFMVIPGIVLAIAWSLSLMLLIDKNISPSEALSLSNKLTYNYRWKIFLAQMLLPWIAMFILILIGGLLSKIASILGIIFNLAVVVAIMPFLIGIQAHIYKTLTGDIAEQQ